MPEDEEEQEEDEKKTGSMITQANLAADRLEKANKVQAALLAQQENLAAETRLAGTAEAGQPQAKKEETPAEYAKKVMENNV